MAFLLLSYCFTLLLTLLPPLLFSPNASPHNSFPYPSPTPHRSLLSNTQIDSPNCSSLPPNNGLINYLGLHHCLLRSNFYLSIPILSSFILLFFYILVRTAQSHFSVVTTKLASQLHLSPSMGAVTLLALGNGAPDVFSSLAAVRSGQYRTGFGAILSAGAFVSALVVGFVAIFAAPFKVDPSSFVRDVAFYLIAAMMLFYVYLSGEISFWQASGFVGFYAFFVFIVFWMDFGSRVDEKIRVSEEVDFEKGSPHLENEIEEETKSICDMISRIWRVPVSVILRLTIPHASPANWSRFYTSANIALCPVLLLSSCGYFVSINHPIGFLITDAKIPLWAVVVLGSTSLASLHYIVEKEPPKGENVGIVAIAFVMSVYWISSVAGELISCLAALGAIVGAPSSLLGLTVLAWGNSVGDLVADVAVARAGQPAMAMAGCFAGPMFNMLVGLGSALVLQTAESYPNAYELKFHMGIVVAFVFLLSSLMGSLLVITWSRFRVPKFWGFFLVGLYVLFMLISVIVAIIV